VDVDGFKHKSKILQEHCKNENRDYSEIGRTLHTNVLIGKDKNDLDNKINKLAEYTNTPKEYYYDRPLIGTKDEVFNTFAKYENEGCTYLIAYIPDIIWGDTVNILSELIES
jgi:hypothetical protein